MSATTTVWRVEDAHGYGPYQCLVTPHRSEFIWSLVDNHSGCRAHPTSWGDGLHPAPGWRHACATRDSLAAWFARFGAELDLHGFGVRTYTLDPADILVGTSGRQVIFRAKDALHTAEQLVTPWWP